MTPTRLSPSGYQKLYSADRPTCGKWSLIAGDAQSAIAPKSCDEKSRGFSLTRFGAALWLARAFVSVDEGGDTANMEPVRNSDRLTTSEQRRPRGVRQLRRRAAVPIRFRKKIVAPRLPDDFLFTICSSHAIHPVPLDTNTLIRASAVPTPF